MHFVVCHNVLIVLLGSLAKNVESDFVTNAHRHVAIAKRVTVTLVMNVYGVKDQVVWYRGLHKKFRVVIVKRLKFGEY